MADTGQEERGDDYQDTAERLLTTLEQLLQLDATNMADTLNAAAHLVGEVTSAEKVDHFLYHPENRTLQVAGLSDTPMSKHEVELGLDRIAIADGGRLVEVFQTGEIYATGHADRDPEMLRGITEELGVRSLLAAALDVGGERRGVLQAASALEDAFSDQDRRFFEATTRWVGLVVHRAELVEQLTLSAAEEARRLTADELITVLAHDLGNLVTPLSLRLQLLRRNIARKGNKGDSKEIEAMLANVARLQGLIMNLLDTARLDHGLFAIEPEMCDLTELVTATAAVLSAPRTPVEVHGEPHVFVQADPARLRQVIENLLENALQHTRPGTPVSVSVDSEPKEETDLESATTPEWATLVIQDHGPGIPPALLPRLFERYVKGQHSLGIGLGLYVSYRIIEAHGGILTAQSIPGRGARFTIRLPLLVDS